MPFLGPSGQRSQKKSPQIAKIRCPRTSRIELPLKRKCYFNFATEPPKSLRNAPQMISLWEPLGAKIKKTASRRGVQKTANVLEKYPNGHKGMCVFQAGDIFWASFSASEASRAQRLKLAQISFLFTPIFSYFPN